MSAILNNNSTTVDLVKYIKNGFDEINIKTVNSFTT